MKWVVVLLIVGVCLVVVKFLSMFSGWMIQVGEMDKDDAEVLKRLNKKEVE